MPFYTPPVIVPGSRHDKRECSFCREASYRLNEDGLCSRCAADNDTYDQCGKCRFGGCRINQCKEESDE